MTTLIKKHLFLVLVAVFAVISIVFGIGGYFAASSNSMPKSAEIEALPWTMPLTDKYSYLMPNENGKDFFAASGSDEYTLDANGKVLGHSDAVSSDSADSGSGSGSGFDSGSVSDSGSGDVPVIFDNGKRHAKYGLKSSSSDGKVLLKAEYSEIRPFANGYSVAAKDGHYMIIDTGGKTVYRPGAYDIQFIAGTDYLVLCEDDWSVYNVTTGKSTKLDFYTTSILEVNSGEYKAFMDNDCWMLLDEHFRPKENRQLYKYIGLLSQGLRYTERYDGRFGNDKFADADIVKGYTDADGKTVIHLPASTVFGGAFADGIAQVYIKDAKGAGGTGNDGNVGKSGTGDSGNAKGPTNAKGAGGTGNVVQILEKSGEVLAEVPLKLPKNLDFGSYIWFPETFTFVNGYAAVYNGSRFGIVDDSGNLVIRPVFDKMYKGSDSLYAVYKDNKVGILDLSRLKKGQAEL